MSDQEPESENGPLLVSISDIDPYSLLSQDLEGIGYTIGVMDMRQAYVMIEPYFGSAGQTAMFVIEEDNWLEMVQLFFSLAVFNYACEVHEVFRVPSMEIGMAQILNRSSSVEEHNEAVGKYLTQVMVMLNKRGGYLSN